MGSNGDPRQEVTGELGAATSCPPSSGGAGRRRTLVMEQRAVLRPYLKVAETYGVLYGSTGAKVEYPGLEGKMAGRTFFLIDQQGIVRGKWLGGDNAVFPTEKLLEAAREVAGRR